MAGDDPGVWLEAEGLTKVYDGVVALNDTSLAIRRGEIRGLVGANGAGKSTLVKLLTGVVTPTEGTVRVDGEPLRLGRPKAALAAGIVAMPQELMVAPSMTVAENVFMGHYPRRSGFLRQREMRRRTQEVLEMLSLSIHPDAPLQDLSLIQQRLVMVARCLSANARLVILDEPTATISPVEVEVILNAIRVLSEKDVSVLYVSHRFDEIEQICTGVTVLRDGRIVADLAAEETTHEKLVDHVVGQSGRRAQRSAEVARAREPGPPLLVVDGVSGERLQDISLAVGEGEIVGLAGLAGSGARDLLMTIYGVVPFSEGSITVCGTDLRSGNTSEAVSAGLGFLPGDRHLAAFPSHSIRFNVSLAGLGKHSFGPFVDRRAEKSAVAHMLDLVSLQRNPELRIGSLSGGNQQKAMVARWLVNGTRLFLLDDPTAGVDVRTRPEIYTQIRAACEAGAGVLLISSDIDELVELADRVIVVERGTLSGELSGDDLTASRLLLSMTGRRHVIEESDVADAALGKPGS